MAMKPRPLDERFWPKVDRSNPGGCWPWLAWKERGYGRIAAGGKRGGMLWAHRVALELALGRPLLKTEQANHKCNNPSCCRVDPDHIVLGSHVANMDHMRSCGRARGRVARGSANGSARLSEAEVSEIRRRASESKRALGREFGVSDTAIRDIVSGRKWRHVS